MGAAKKAVKLTGTLAAVDVLVKIGAATVSVIVAVKAIKALTRDDE